MTPLYVCEKCGKDVYQAYGSGRFCSKECAHSRTQTAEMRMKKSNKLSSSNKTINIFIDRIEKESRDRDFVCQYCDKRFIKAHDLSAHITKKHINKSEQLYKLANGVVLDVTNEYIDKYKSQQLTCEICGRTVTESVKYEGKYKAKQLCVDHDHMTNKFRGLLCQQCNRSLGFFEKYKEEILLYLDKKNT